ncbi:hypothetical protein [Candidatus Neptunochlamydia vexilliferae]|uniref:CdiI immunity protein domain-containing protein n=1 Tax=Candidatus Neptunichlamydia vexilliferae TaxID=1651774 RepID=A0ABS0B1D9_9BACT|nr:hypothetical protein [Candidatus Neptunochlamydia vexilliferae]MBF5060196.1 hypothetical protein [Candidatus Neptunochlamydia vexilliferae]
MVTDKDREYILNEHLRNISHISDKERQRRVWINGEGPDFDEAVCYFFDIGDPILENYEDYGITEKQHQTLKRLRDEFETFSDDHYWPTQFIDTPEWEEIISLAKEVLKEFGYKSAR